ncbi:MAG: DNA alkylation repair protein [Prevotella sp.]
MDVNIKHLGIEAGTDMTDAKERLKAIKAWYRLRMNGIASRSMRDKGLEYKIIWGISLPELSAYAKEHGKDYDLSILLWQEDIRESKILAIMMMPHEKMTANLTKTWTGEIPNQEIAEIAAMHLFQHLKDAKNMAMEWISTYNDIVRICGYQTLSRLFMKGITLEKHEAEEFYSQAQAAMHHDNLAVRHAVANALTHLRQTE